MPVTYRVMGANRLTTTYRCRFMSDERVFLRAILYCAVALLAVACEQAALEPKSTPSPVIGAESDRLWILARASKFGDGRRCK